MKQKLVKFYIKYTIHKPVLFIFVIAVGLFSILCLSFTTKTNVISTYDCYIENGIVYVSKKIETQLDVIYLYSDRNEAVYMCSVIKTQIIDDVTSFELSKEEGIVNLQDWNMQKMKIDIPCEEMTLFKRVFIKGGRVYNE